MPLNEFVHNVTVTFKNIHADNANSTQSRFVFLQLLVFPYDKIAAEKEISNCR